MKRMTTDNPQLNIERLLNTARAENNQAVLHLGDEVITLAEYVAKCAKERGCDITQESVMDGDNCVECDCPVAILNILGIQAAENNARLKIIEKILGDDYDLNRLKELVEADREGRCVVLPGKPGEMVRFIGNPSAKPEVVDAISVYADGRITYNFHTTGMMTRYVDEWSEDDAYKYCSVNGTMKESENDDRA